MKVQKHQDQSLAESQLDSEHEARSKLSQDADSLAMSDLEAKTKIKHATELAAASQKQKALSFKKKLE
jgi:hypothetical protein